MPSCSAARLYGILDLAYVDASRAVRMAEAMLEGGVQILQLRAKDFPLRDVASLGRILAPLCRRKEMPFILNDYPEMAAEIGADGVHVGQDDLPVGEVRKIVGSEMMIGKSTHSLSQAQAAVAEGADYIGFGPLFATATKPDYVPIGLDDMRAVHQAVKLPIFCIGGIKQENLPGILQAGGRRVVIVSGILQAADVASYCRECRQLLDHG